MIYREGDAGEAVRDIQRRLLALGETIADDERAATRYGPSTTQAVRAFQQHRGLMVDGIVGTESWRELVEASWRLGDRVVYIRSPQMRGDDVRELQDRLSRLGFDSGRIDGIFGPQTVRALMDFQRNFGLPHDGIVGAATVRSLVGMPSFGGDTQVTLLREREAMRRLPPSLAGLTVVLDPGHGGSDTGLSGPAGVRESDIAFAIARRLEGALAATGVAVFLTRDESSNPTDAERGSLANTLSADLYIAIHAAGALDAGETASGSATYFFGNDRWQSEGGKQLAESIQDSLVELGLTDGRTHVKTWGVLRETRMPAVQVEPCYITNPAEERMLADPAFQGRVADAIFAALRTLTQPPMPV